GLLGQVGLSDRWDSYPAELSGGEQRRVALARALVNEPRVLLADEPTNDLDEQAEREVLGLLHQLRRLRNTTGIVVPPDPTLAQRADRMLYLRAGKLASVAVPSSDDKVTERHQEPITSSPCHLVTLSPGHLVTLGGGLGRFLVGFVGWALLIVCGLWGIDY